MASTNNRCPLCNSPARLKFQAQDVNRRLSPEKFNYYQCLNCGLIFLWPVPDDPGGYYPRDYYAIPASLERLTFQAQSDRYKIDLVQKFVSGGRLLEIGPAYGSFAFLAKQAGFEVHAIEMDEECCRFLSEVVGVRAIHSAQAASALAATGPYQVIALWQVIEHLPDPWLVLEAVARQLLPNGILVVATPNPEAFQFRLLGRFWAHLDTPRHLALIPASLLTRRMQTLGLSSLLLTTTDKGSIGWNSFGWSASLKNFFTNPAVRSTAHFAGRALAKLFIPVERSGWRGSAYTAIFQKVQSA